MAKKEMTPTSKEQEVGLAQKEEPNWLSPAIGWNASPWQMMRRAQEDMDRIFDRFFSASAPLSPTSIPTWSPSIDVSETDKEYCIEAELPGVGKDDITVEIEDHQLTLQAKMSQEKEQQEKERQYYRRERRSGYLARTLTLPPNVNEEQINCTFKDGVLTCHLPKTAQSASRGRRIEIATTESAPPQA